LSASIGTVSDAHDNAVAESFIGVFNNEMITAGSPFRTGPLRTLADVEAITMNCVDWYNNHRLHAHDTTSETTNCTATGPPTS
jgi:transposase InsO family protein